MQKTLGFHFCPNPKLLFDCLKKRVKDNNEELFIPGADFPILDRPLYASEPWNVFNDNDPWEVNYSTVDKGYVERKIYVYVKLRKTGKRFVRTAGCGVWEGSTGYQPVKGVEGDQKGQILGLKGIFNYNVKGNMSVGNSNGEWRMNEFKLGGKDLEGLEENHIARVLVVCQITQKVDTKSQCYLSWPKGILDMYLDYLKPYGVFDPKEKEDSDATRKIEAKRPSSESDENSNKRQRMNEDEETDFFPSINPVGTSDLDPNSWQYKEMFKISYTDVQDNSSRCRELVEIAGGKLEQMIDLSGEEFQFAGCSDDYKLFPVARMEQFEKPQQHDDNGHFSDAQQGDGYREEAATTFINECEDNGESSSRVMNEDEQNEFADELLFVLQNNE